MELMLIFCNIGSCSNLNDVLWNAEPVEVSGAQNSQRRPSPIMQYVKTGSYADRSGLMEFLPLSEHLESL